MFYVINRQNFVNGDIIFVTRLQLIISKNQSKYMTCITQLMYGGTKITKFFSLSRPSIISLFHTGSQT